MDRRPDLHRDFDAVLDQVRAAPADAAGIELIVRRPDRDEREVVEVAVVDPIEGMVGDHWKARGSRSTPDGSASLESQLTLMGTRVLAAIEPDRSRWPLAGDQLYLDLDLSKANLPAGSRLAIGEVLVEVSEKPHTGCAKFSARFGSDAVRWVNSPTGLDLRLRGVNVRIIRGGTIRVGDVARKA